MSVGEHLEDQERGGQVMAFVEQLASSTPMNRHTDFLLRWVFGFPTAAPTIPQRANLVTRPQQTEIRRAVSIPFGMLHAMSLQAPPPVAANPIELIARDLRNEWRTPVPYPPGDTSFDLSRAGAMLRNPLPLLLDGYARYGPVYTLRLLSSKVIVLLGPEANHHLLVANQANFSWREGSFANLIPLLGDGLLTIDGDFHRRSRKIMLPVFHHEHIAAALETMTVETEQAMSAWRAGDRVDLYDWTRKLALRIAMRALFGLDPDGPAARSIDAARLFNEALHFYSYDLPGAVAARPGDAVAANAARPARARPADLQRDRDPAQNGRARSRPAQPAARRQR